MFKFVVVLTFVAAASAINPIQLKTLHGGGFGGGSAGGGSAGGGSYGSSHGSSDDVHAEIKSLDSDVRPDGFNYAFETTNHIRADAAGDEHGNIRGSFEWISPEGQHVLVKYVADENGYQPSSDVLPTPPPTPVAILMALEYIRSHPQKEEGLSVKLLNELAKGSN